MLRLALAALVFASAAVAQEAPRTVVAEGTAEISVPPDVATVVFSVRTEGRDQALTFRTHEEEVGRVLTAVRRLRIPDRDIEITNAQFSSSGRSVSASRTVRVKTDSLRIVPDLVSAIVEAGAEGVQSVTYGLSDPDRHSDAALDAAVARARARAERMAAGAGARLGNVRAIRESGVSAPQPRYRVDGVSFSEVVVQENRSVGAAYSAANQTVTARVVLEYDLIPE